MTFAPLAPATVLDAVALLRTKGIAPVLVDASGIFAVFSYAGGEVDCKLMCIRDGKPCPVELAEKAAYETWRAQSVRLMQETCKVV